MAIPKYQQIANTLIDELDHDHLHQGDRFYSEAEIQQRFGVSSTTAVKVLNMLQSQNRVTRIKGRGTFVAKESHRRVVFLTDLNMAQARPEWTKVISVTAGNDATIRKQLNLPAGVNYIQIVRLRMIGDDVAQYAVSNINGRYIDERMVKNPDNFISVYQRIRDDSGINPFKLPYAQRNTAGPIDTDIVQHYFPDRPTEQTFIQQYRTTYLPTERGDNLEYAVSFKLPEFWGLQTASPYGFDGM